MQVNIKTAALAVALVLVGVWIAKRQATPGKNDTAGSEAGNGTGWSYFPQGMTV